MNKTQIVICKCGQTIAACKQPHCYTDNDWLKDLRNFIKQGCKVDLIETERVNLQNCKCPTNGKLF